MALKKSVDTAQGYAAEYFRIAALWQDKRSVGVRVALYKDKAARDAGKAAVDPNYTAKKILNDSGFSFELTEQQFVDSESVYELAYEYLKTLPIFNGAEDV